MAFSPRSKNMPSLVRSTLRASPPVCVSTVSERARRRRAAAIRPSHSSSDSRSPNTMTRGRRMVWSTCTRRSPASMYSGELDRSGPGRPAVDALGRQGLGGRDDRGLPLDALQGEIDRGVLPAGGPHRSTQAGHRMAGRELRHDPFAEFGADRLARTHAGLRRNTIRSGLDAGGVEGIALEVESLQRPGAWPPCAAPPSAPSGRVPAWRRS